MSAVSEIMSPKKLVVTSVKNNSSALDVTKLMIRNKVGSVVLVDGDGKPVGIVTERDLLRKVSAANKPAKSIAVKSIMSSPVITIRSYDSVETAAAVMEKNGIKRLVVLEEDGSCAGVLSTTDIARKLGKDTCRRLQPICSHESGIGSLKALQRMTARIGRHYHATPPLAKFASVRAYCSPTPLTHAETRKYE